MVWILPTLSRPKQCAEILKRISDSGCTTEGILFVNGPNHAEEYGSIDLPEGWGRILSYKNLGCLGALNKIFDMMPNEPWYGFIGDDEFLISAPVDWDKQLIDAAGNWGISHGWDDLHKGNRLQGYPVFGGDLVRAVGYLAVPTCFHSFGFDSAWEWLFGPKVFGGGEAGKIKLVSSVKIEHRHYGWGKSPEDECYRVGNSSFEEDRKRFVDWQRGDMPMAVERIRKARGAL